MESFGEILKKSRESQGIDILQVERDTAISKEYIDALEKEDVSAFPGEPYLVGFLRNYAEYLGLDAKYVVSLYKAKMIQESPVPDELLKIAKPAWVKPVIISCVSVVVAVGIFLALFFTLKKEKNAENALLEEAKTGKTYELTTTPYQKRVYKNDILKLMANKQELDVKIIGTKEYLSIETPVGIQVIELGEEVTLNLDKVEGPDIGIFVSDISKTDEMKGAEIRMWSFDDSPIPKAVKEVVVVQENQENENITKSEELTQKQVNGQIVLFEGYHAYPFTVEILFRGASLFRVSPDGKESEENYFTAGTQVTKTVNNKIRLWMSNANALQISVIGDGKTEKIEVGRPGQVMVKDIKWIKEAGGVYKLVVLEVE